MQNITRDIEVKNKQIVTRGQWVEGSWGKIEEGPSTNMHKGHID